MVAPVRLAQNQLNLGGARWRPNLVRWEHPTPPLQRYTFCGRLSRRRAGVGGRGVNRAQCVKGLAPPSSFLPRCLPCPSSRPAHRSPQRGVDCVGAVGGADDDHGPAGAGAIQERQQGGHHAGVRLVRCGALARGGQPVQLVKEDDAGARRRSRLEQQPQLPLRVAHVLAQAVRALHAPPPRCSATQHPQ
jgi:hypothetical protein